MDLLRPTWEDLKRLKISISFVIVPLSARVARHKNECNAGVAEPGGGKQFFRSIVAKEE